MNGERHTLPLATPDRKLRVGQEGTNVVVQTAAGLRLLYNAATYLLLTVPAGYRGHLCGLGGNYNGDPSDDFRLPNGTLANSAQEFVASWKVPAEEGACSPGCEGGACRRCTAAEAATYGTHQACGLINDPTGPFGGCHPWVSPAEYFNHCLHDVCAAAGEPGVLCQSLQAYGAACQAAGAQVGAWRTAKFCRKC